MQYHRKAITENDIVLIYIENVPAFFARVEKISPDAKAGWWRINLLVLRVPVKIVTWILDNQQIRGAEFTMSGTPVRMEKIEVPTTSASETMTETNSKSQTESTKSARILSLTKKMNG